MPTVGPQDLARFFEDDVSYIHRLVKEGMPQQARGKYDLGKCMLWYIRYLQAQLSRLSPNVDMAGGEVDNERKERIRLLRADAELRELELARERGEFMALTDVGKIVTDLIVMTKARILAVASRVAPQLVGEPRTVIEAKIDRALKDALTILANHNQNGNAVGTATSELTASLVNDSDTES
jgi:phage terminase Nu1 subunit (DNA packaging protein)